MNKGTALSMFPMNRKTGTVLNAAASVFALGLHGFPIRKSGGTAPGKGCKAHSPPIQPHPPDVNVSQH